MKGRETLLSLPFRFIKLKEMILQRNLYIEGEMKCDIKNKNKLSLKESLTRRTRSGLDRHSKDGKEPCLNV